MVDVTFEKHALNCFTQNEHILHTTKTAPTILHALTYCYYTQQQHYHQVDTQLCTPESMVFQTMAFALAF